MSTDPIADLIRRMMAYGLHLVALEEGLKKPVQYRWTGAPALTLDEAVAHVNRQGNLGVNLRNSHLVVLDAENAAATAALREAGFIPTVVPAKAQVPEGHSCAAKIGGSHTWLRVPSGIDEDHLRTALGVRLSNGGVLDVLAGSRQAVAPPSALSVADGRRYVPARGGALDPDSGVTDLDIAPEWLFDPSYLQRHQPLLTV